MAKPNKAAVQELYRHLDRTGCAGDRQLAWYGQLRAEGQTHEEALENSIVHFKLRDEDWYQARMARYQKRERT